MRGFPKQKNHKESHALRVRILVAKHWERIGVYWISPYSGVKYTESNAIAVEELRGTFRQGYKKDWVFA